MAEELRKFDPGAKVKDFLDTYSGLTILDARKYMLATLLEALANNDRKVNPKGVLVK
jgi:hypothetical protein